MRREEQPRQRVLFTEGSLETEGEGDLDAHALSPFLTLPAHRRPLSVSPPQDKPLCDDPLRVAIKPRQCLVLGVLPKDAVGGLRQRSRN